MLSRAGGTFTFRVKQAAGVDKPIYLVNASGEVIHTEAGIANSAYKDITVEVTKGAMYFLYQAGSKLKFGGFTFTPSEKRSFGFNTIKQWFGQDATKEFLVANIGAEKAVNGASHTFTLTNGLFNWPLTFTLRGFELNNDRAYNGDKNTIGKFYSIKVSSGGDFTISGNGVSLYKIILYGVSDKRNFTASTGSIGSSVDFTGAESELYKTTWTQTWEAPKGVSSVTFKGEHGHTTYLTRIDIQYAEKVDYPNIWNINTATVTEWQTATTQLNKSNSNWKAIMDGNTIDSWEFNGESAIYDVDLLNGLTLSKSSSSGHFSILNREKNLYSQGTNTIIVPKVPAGYRVVVNGGGSIYKDAAVTFSRGTDVETKKVEKPNNNDANTVKDYVFYNNGTEAEDVKVTLKEFYVYKISVIPHDDFTSSTEGVGNLNIDNPDIPAYTGGYKYSMKTAGYIGGGKQVKSVPGMIMTYGNDHDIWCADTYSEYNQVLATAADAPASPYQGVPTSGTYYVFEPFANGLLTINALVYQHHTIVLVDQNGNDYDSFTSTKGYNSITSFTFDKPLIAGQKYYVYDRGYEGEVSDLSLKDFTYLPIFVLNGKDVGPNTIDFSRKNDNYTFPRLADESIDLVRYELKNPENDVKIRLTNSYGDENDPSKYNVGGLTISDGKDGGDWVRGYTYAADGSQNCSYAEYCLYVTTDERGFAYTKSFPNGSAAKVEFTTAGFVRDKTITLPGITMTFGAPGEVWMAKADKTSTYYKNSTKVATKCFDLNGNEVVSNLTQQHLKDQQGIPTSGTFYKFHPTVNGFLKLDGSFYNKHYIMVVCAYNDLDEEGKLVQRSMPEFTNYFRYINPNGEYHYYGEMQESVFLMGGYDYYVYDLGSDVTQLSNVYSFELHGFTFTPAFVKTEKDKAPITEDTTKLGSIYHMFPHIVPEWLGDKAPGKPKSSNEKVAKIEIQSYDYFDEVLQQEISYNYYEIKPLTKGDTRISYEITDGKNTISTGYNLHVIKGEPTTWRLTKGDKPTVRGKIEGNIPGITMTFGGWENYWNKDSLHTYTFVQNGEVQTGTDKYSTPETDMAGTLDGFAYWSHNGFDARLENKEQFNPEDYNMFSVPCRGTYYKFEPKVNGKLDVYVLQNGIINGGTDDNPFVATENSPSRRVFMIDESGVLVWSNYVQSGGTYYFPASALNWRAANLIIENLGLDLNLLTEADMNLDKNGNYTANRQAFIDYYVNYLQGKDQEVLYTDDGFGAQTLEKAMMHYNFDVEAGKTYYFFGYHTKIGISGFIFNEDEETEKTYAPDIEDTNTSPYIPEVTNLRINSFKRSLKAGVWSTIVLPYSMNETQVKKVFGEDVDMVYLSNISGKTIYFTRHYYRTITAGVPCIIKPTKDVDNLALPDDGSSEWGKGTNFAYVTVGSGKEIVNESFGDYSWVASYAPQTITEGDYYFSATTGKINRMSSQGTPNNLLGYRAYIRRDNSAAAKLGGTYFGAFDDENDNTATGIQVIDSSTSEDKNINGVYTIDGRKVSGNYGKLDKGFYIVNGKKVIVK